MAEPLPLTRESVKLAHDIVRPHVHLTPVYTSKTLNRMASTPQTPTSLVGTQFEGRKPASPNIRLFFKCENLQRIGAFKARGAFHAISRLPEDIRKKGIVTHSSGMF
jgi:threonine dehydratase